MGAANNAWLISKEYTENRIMFKKPLAANQLIQKKLANNANRDIPRLECMPSCWKIY